MRKVLLLGASGNIGTQVIDLIKDNSSFQLVGISIGQNIKMGEEFLSSFPSIKYFYSINKMSENIQKQYPYVTFFYGEDGLTDLVKITEFDLLVNALVGFIGLKPTIEGLKKNKTVCLANKESLVVGGELIYKLIDQGYGNIIPIDSEHVAIDKCINASNKKPKRLILTASGGAFRNLAHKDLDKVKSSDALKHPTWNMGKKITIDCASMMNKCFEIIEAYYMFSKKCDKISVLLHYESMIHSMIQYYDGMYRAEISAPDMHNAIRYALYERDEIVTTYTAHNYRDFGPYTFKKVSMQRYPLLKYAKVVIENKGLYGCALNAANEVCVQAYLNDEISMLKLEKIIAEVMEQVPQVNELNYVLIEQYDAKFRQLTSDLLRK